MVERLIECVLLTLKLLIRLYHAERIDADLFKRNIKIKVAFLKCISLDSYSYEVKGNVDKMLLECEFLISSLK